MFGRNNRCVCVDKFNWIFYPLNVIFNALLIEFSGFMNSQQNALLHNPNTVKTKLHDFQKILKFNIDELH